MMMMIMMLLLVVADGCGTDCNGGSSGGSDNSGAGDHVRPLLSSSFYEYA